MFAFHSDAWGISTSVSSLKMSNGTSSTTGPRLPVIIVFHAWRVNCGTISARVGWYTRLQ